MLFGMGAALTLDEFALWLRLDDVYWGPEGRRSVDAVLLATLVGLLLLVGFSPFDDDSTGGEVALGITIALNLLFVLAAILKGRIVFGVLGLFVPIIAFVATCRLAPAALPVGAAVLREGSRGSSARASGSPTAVGCGGSPSSTCSRASTRRLPRRTPHGRPGDSPNTWVPRLPGRWPRSDGPAGRPAPVHPRRARSRPPRGLTRTAPASPTSTAAAPRS